MPDDFGCLEQQVMERIEEDRVEQRRRASRKAVALAEDIARAHDSRAAIQKAFAGIPEPDAPVTPEEKLGLTVSRARIPASPAPDDAIGLVDPSDGALKMFSRTEIFAKVNARPPGMSQFDFENGHAGTFDRPLRREVADLTWPWWARGGLGRVAGATGVVVLGWIAVVGTLSFLHSVWP
jgi:hypothetical protein